MTEINKRLRKAAANGLETELKALLREQNCDTSSTSESGMTALMWGAWFGHEKCVQVLLPKSDALALDNTGMTALIHAAWFGHEECVRLLLPVSDALGKGENGVTALMRAARGGHEKCVRLLLPASNVFAVDDEGWTASAYAHNRLHKSLAQFIDAYVLAQSEHAAIEVAVSYKAPHKRVSPRG